MLGVNLVTISSVAKTLELATDTQKFSKTHFFVVRVSQNGSIHRKLKTDFLYDHYSFSLLYYTFMWNNIEGYFQLRQRRRGRVRKYRFMCEVTCVDSRPTKDRTTAVNIAGNIWRGTSFSLGQFFISFCLEGGGILP